MDYPCDVELIARHSRCAETPARRFTATCQCGHDIGGHMCGKCSVSRLPGCNTCWQDGAGHCCPVTFDSAECLCGCGEQAPMSTRNDARYHLKRGRPARYAQGHRPGCKPHAEPASPGHKAADGIEEYLSIHGDYLTLKEAARRLGRSERTVGRYRDWLRQQAEDAAP